MCLGQCRRPLKLSWWILIWIYLSKPGEHWFCSVKCSPPPWISQCLTPSHWCYLGRLWKLYGVTLAEKACRTSWRCALRLCILVPLLSFLFHHCGRCVTPWFFCCGGITWDVLVHHDRLYPPWTVNTNPSSLKCFFSGKLSWRQDKWLIQSLGPVGWGDNGVRFCTRPSYKCALQCGVLLVREAVRVWKQHGVCGNSAFHLALIWPNVCRGKGHFRKKQHLGHQLFRVR